MLYLIIDCGPMLDIQNNSALQFRPIYRATLLVHYFIEDCFLANFVYHLCFVSIVSIYYVL